MNTVSQISAHIPPAPTPVVDVTCDDLLSGIIDTESLVHHYLDRERIQVMSDGSLKRHFDPNAELAVRLRRKPIDSQILLDEVVDFGRRIGSRFRKSEIGRSLRLVIEQRRADRRCSLLEPLIKPNLTVADRARAEKDFLLFANLFDADSELMIAGLKQFIWVTKRKQVGDPVGYPLMLIVQNKVQGSGKSELVLRLLKPLAELASDSVAFSEVADTRNVALFQNAVVNIDDAGLDQKLNFAILKAAITNLNRQSRILGSSKQQRFSNLASFIATTNENILSLIPDHSGHRRFLVMPMKNGAVEKGGSPEVWAIMEQLDFELMWKSVSVEGPEPILAHQESLHAYQASYRAPDPIATWACKLDITSDAVRNITGPHGIEASRLYDLFCDQTGEEVGNKEFGTEIMRLIMTGEHKFPFVRRTRNKNGRVYVLRPSTI